MINAAVNTYRALHPTEPMSLGETLSTVEQWAFQPEQSDLVTDIVQDDSVLSLAQQRARDSYIETRNRMGWEEHKTIETRILDMSVPEGSERLRREKTFEGTSYRLTIKSN